MVSWDEKQTLSSKFRCFSHSLQGASASSKNQRRRLIIAVQVSLGSFSNNFDELTHDITNYMKMGRIIISIFESTYKIILRDSRQKKYLRTSVWGLLPHFLIEVESCLACAKWLHKLFLRQGGEKRIFSRVLWESRRTKMQAR